MKLIKQTRNTASLKRILYQPSLTSIVVVETRDVRIGWNFIGDSLKSIKNLYKKKERELRLLPQSSHGKRHTCWLVTPLSAHLLHKYALMCMCSPCVFMITTNPPTLSRRINQVDVNKSIETGKDVIRISISLKGCLAKRHPVRQYVFRINLVCSRCSLYISADV